jgi:hypothetical protein
MPLFLLYFIILTNLYCAETLNIVLSFVIDVHFVMVLLLVVPQMWRFPYPFGFCNPVRIYGRKINDDDDYVIYTDTHEAPWRKNNYFGPYVRWP